MLQYKITLYKLKIVAISYITYCSYVHTRAWTNVFDIWTSSNFYFCKCLNAERPHSSWSESIFPIVIFYGKQKHLGCKEGEANQKQQLSDLYIHPVHATKSFDISQGQELADYRYRVER